jgi:hypothetical protein
MLLTCMSTVRVHALGPVVENGCELWGDRCTEDPLRQSRGLVLVERLNCQLMKLTSSPKLCSHAPQRVPPGDLVASIGTDNEQWNPVERNGQSRQKLEGGVVGPLQIVQEHRGRSLRSY